ncbi:glycoside hydrolase [Rhodococcus sp. ABRD24]|uniref:glycoside hydrolase family 25 protein n=1 Tax=Rhodococcus sp. ABRD24 TaxID=2507582 RepID=UPI00103AEA7C|nr:glycoside hydrolase family 25 protein [Rhodococcus sp. ABRD24]QBJ96461.1 glycoside hydrolase [Rhodococcus sp. ABRD24]
MPRKSGWSLARIAPLLLAGAVTLAAPAAAIANPQGPDVSSWQHGNGAPIDWFQVRGAGQEFAMVKATEGLFYTNPYFAQDSISMRIAGVARGAYHYADPSTSPEAQAAFFAATALAVNQIGGMPPVLDLESTGGLAAPQLIDWTHRYLNAVQAITGRTPIIYTYPNFWRTAMANTNEFTRYPLWIADYNGRNAPGPLPGGWQNWAFWQYTDSGRLPGINGNVDLNVYSGSLGDINVYARNFFGS